MSSTTYSRRRFLQTGGTLTGGLLVSFFIPASAKRLGEKAASADVLFVPNAYLSITPDNNIKILLSHVEMGQGVWTTLPMLMAEELDCDWDKISVEHAPPGEPYKHTAYGIQITGGSTSTWSEFDRYRNAGATARALLVQAAAQKLNVPVSAIKTEKGFVIAGDKRISYGELAEAASKLPAPTNVTLKDKKDWQYLGKPMRRLDAKAKTNGAAKFGLDVYFPDMLIAVVAHSPVFGGTVKTFDASAAKAVKGVRDVVKIPTGVAVIADHFWAAKKGRDALKIDWDPGAGKSFDTVSQFQEYKKLAGTKGTPAGKAGAVDEAMPKTTKKIQAEYIFPYLAHATMEPMNCTVKVTGNTCEIWTGTQMPGLDQAAAAKILGFKPEQVTLHTQFLGGGFGRRATPGSDFVSEAVQVAKASGKPIKLVWSREDDMRGGYYRPAFLHQVTIGLGNDGLPAAWQHRIVGQSIVAGTPFEGMIKDGIDATSVEGVNDSPYLESIPNYSIELHSPKTPVSVLWWRSVGHTHTAFVMETLIDELATAAGKDPVAYRRSILKSKRHLGVLELAAEKAGWNNPLPAGQFRGIAVHESFGSFVAQVAEISIDKGQLKVHRVVCAVDCGTAINPEGVRAQMESGIIFGLTAVLYGEITLENGQVKQRNFHDYKILRMNEAPLIEVHILESGEKMGGCGEPGTPPIAPAIANAIFAATGKRVRQLPLKPADLKQA
ncbi:MULTISPECIES: xanthine dehydrogenase family protein molybdopterin-binding subunit [Niastella]|uniref:Xanthine dehydrogenase family protein molybdopterin-binding subunit n=1 Tax=Niastella soli TaxID=2821487 RepID=A0ABS3Z3D5_9BACT|nr:xanthine dehydrogenase family protein molybdopterin-binding subunit [Niastella soli]MBO9204682.1 xanthine dehydrogenase family protein molybdopterin-binding subunit [Niastella soli]